MAEHVHWIYCISQVQDTAYLVIAAKSFRKISGLGKNHCEYSKNGHGYSIAGNNGLDQGSPNFWEEGHNISPTLSRGPEN